MQSARLASWAIVTLSVSGDIGFETKCNRGRRGQMDLDLMRVFRRAAEQRVKVRRALAFYQHRFHDEAHAVIVARLRRNDLTVRHRNFLKVLERKLRPGLFSLFRRKSRRRRRTQR